MRDDLDFMPLLYVLAGVTAISCILFVLFGLVSEYEAKLRKDACICAQTTNYTYDRCLFEMKR